jgi:hypothetical protein
MAAPRLAFLAEHVVAQPVLAADLEDGVAAFAAARNTLRRAHALPARRVADFAVIAACAETALFGGAAAYDAPAALLGGAAARGAAAIFGVAAFGAAQDLVGVTLFLGEASPGK